MQTKKDERERVILVGVDLGASGFNLESSMIELAELVDAAGGVVVGVVTQNRDRPESSTFIGQGKVYEVCTMIEDRHADAVVFNDELRGSQMRNLEALCQCKIIDRTNLILDIFAARATSAEGKLQVKLAQLNYRLPRLIGYSDYLSRPGGGIGTRGPGEQKLELDRRHIKREIMNVEQALAKVSENRATTRKQRVSSGLPILALVGYTNAGKSTLMNQIIANNDPQSEKKMVYAEDMLFATLDTTLRQTKLNNGLNVLLTDTVGFVSKLPHALINAFKGTLEEITYADVLIHVVDASNPDLNIQMDTTYSILKDLGVLDIPMITVFNKMDLAEEQPITHFTNEFGQRIYISAHNHDDIDRLIDMIEVCLEADFIKAQFKVPFESMSVLDDLSRHYEVTGLTYTETDACFWVLLHKDDAKRYERYIVKEKE